MNKRGLILEVVVIGILLVVGFFWFTSEYNSKPEQEEECVKVQTGCCPCNMGGEEKCVLKGEADKYEEKLESCSESLICPALYACNIESCEYVNRECVSK